MSKIKSIEELKNEYVGKTYGFLTITDIISNGKGREAVCICKCGNIKTTKLNKITSGHTISCGCYVHSKEKSDKLKAAWTEEKRELNSIKLTTYYKEHPEEAKQQGNNISEWCKNNPEGLQKRIKSFQLWCKNNKELLKELGENHSLFYKEHPEVGVAAGNKTRQWYINNPEKVKIKSNNLKQYYIDHPERRVIQSIKSINWCEEHSQEMIDLAIRLSNEAKQRRSNSDFSSIIDYIHDDYKEDLLSGNLDVYSDILTKCPLCNNYDLHTLGNVFIFSRSEFKFGKPPLCAKCRNSLIVSSYEKEIEDYIRSFYNGEIIRNSREIINPQELDIYIPEKKIAIEFNGDYFHDENHKDKDYHINKYLKCKEKDILLISIFESEWNNRKEEIKEYLKDLFDGKENKLSFNEDHTLMNNNYPSINKRNLDSNIIDDYYIYNGNKIFTCGYSKILL